MGNGRNHSQQKKGPQDDVGEQHTLSKVRKGKFIPGQAQKLAHAFCKAHFWLGRVSKATACDTLRQTS